MNTLTTTRSNTADPTLSTPRDSTAVVISSYLLTLMTLFENVPVKLSPFLPAHPSR